MHLKAAIFDMDGVITDTASLHAVAWKEMFNVFLKQYSQETNSEFIPFSHDEYLHYVDGKPREDGIRSFLEHRHIELSLGSADDTIAEKTINGLGNYKNQMFNQMLEKQGVSLFPATIKLIKQLRDATIKVGIVTSSKNCQQIIERANITNLFDVKVDGVVTAKLGLKGKPAADTYLEAAKELNVAPKDALIVEDAISGVASGRAGEFGLVIGIDRKGTMQQKLKSAGADIVVNDLQELSFYDLKTWFDKA